MKQILPVLFLFLVFTAFPSSALATISFTIDNPVREGDYFIVDATISGISSGSAYVQGMFTQITSTSYFGFTWGQKEDWVGYQGTTSKDFISQNFPILLRDTLQKIWIRPDFSNSAFKGSGDYFLKLRRYTGVGDSHAGESNSLTIYLLEPTPIPTESPTPIASPTSSPTVSPTANTTPDPTLTLNPTRTPTPTPLKTPIPIKTPTPTIATPAQAGIHQITPSPSLTSDIRELSSTSSSILGTSTSSSTVSFQAEGPSPTSVIPDLSGPLVPEGVNPSQSSSSALKYTFIFGALLSAGSGGWLYFRHKKD